MSCTAFALLFSLVTAHPTALDEYEWLTPGGSVRCDNVEVGVYSNSIARLSVYAGVRLSTPVPRVRLLVGGVVGYTDGIAPAAAITYDVSESHELLVIPPAGIGDKRSVLAVTWRFKFK